MTIRTCLLATIAVTVLATTSFADGPFDKFLPRGRLLKKLRDEVMGSPEPKQPTPAAKPKGASQKGPTPAVRPSSQQRPQTSSDRSSQLQRSQANRQSQPKRPTMVNSGPDGFGMSVVIDKKDNIIVAQVAPKGNAAEAGLQRGDVVVEAGGVELTSIEEYQEIAKMLGAGDQLDLKVTRRGRPSTVTIQYGQPPSLEDVEVGDVNAQAGKLMTGSQAIQTESGVSRGYQNDFSFVPPADDDSRPGMRSVVERSTPARPASTRQRAIGQLKSTRPATPPKQLPQNMSQQQQIQMLQQQLEQLRRQQGMTGSGLRNLRGGR